MLGRYLGTCSPDQARIDISDNKTRFLTIICQAFSPRSAAQRMAAGFPRLSVLATLCRQHPNEAALLYLSDDRWLKANLKSSAVRMGMQAQGVMCHKVKHGRNDDRL